MGATLSECRKYRYILSRKVDDFGGKVFAYFGVNPSTADETIDDQTVKKWISFTAKNSGSRFVVGNVFAYRATEVNELASAEDPVGPDNDEYISKIINQADVLVPCWGSRDKLPKHLREHLDRVMSLLLASGKPVLCFGFTASGDPKHPMMLSYETKLVPID
ncbi:DUF1643 domain-containing protein [Microbulbifer sp. SSSA005]|uniref:DUF1643 domain-containing protein n=1 Tax=Microbulbifer sp. SSSA005 TaxID=3243378 RepID=UPI00403A670E